MSLLHAPIHIDIFPISLLLLDRARSDASAKGEKSQKRLRECHQTWGEAKIFKRPAWLAYWGLDAILIAPGMLNNFDCWGPT